MMAREKKISYYDLLAEIIARLRRINRDLYNDPAKRRSIQSNPAWKQEVEAFLCQHPQLENYHAACMNGIDEPVAEEVRDWVKDHDFFQVLELALRLDRGIPWVEQIRLPDVYQNGERAVAALNGNERETGVVLFPRVPSFQDDRTPSTEEAVPTRKWQSHFAPGVNQELKNVYYAPAEDLTLRGEPCRIIHHILDELPVSVRKTLRVAMSPVLQDARLRKEVYARPAGKEQENLLSLHGIENWERVKARIRAAFLEACQQAADILIFPEMLGDKAIFSESSYSAFFSELAREAEEEGLPAPYLVVGPTWWHDHHNQLYVLRGSGDYICVMEKQFSYEHREDGQNYREDIRPGAPEIHIIHSPGLGRIAFPICADLLYEEMRDLLIRTLHCNFMICPSFSRGKTLFTRICGEGVSHGITVVWLTSCSAVQEPPDYVGVLETPGQNVCLCPECEGQCGADSGACLFLSDLDLDSGTFGAVRHIRPLEAVDSA